MNAGEMDELKAKLALIYWRDNNLNGIKSVSLEAEYLSHGLNLDEIKNKSDNEIITICNQCNANKAPAASKADVIINRISYSLKSHRKALPALLNHTHRDGIIKVCSRIGLDISRLDTLISKYWEGRISGVHGEDVKFIGSAFSKDKQAMVKLLEYFLFTGTAMKNSNYPASKLYKFTDPFNFATWAEIDKLTAADEIISNTTISIRKKSITNFNPKGASDKEKNMAPWMKFADGAYRGEIHIRG